MQISHVKQCLTLSGTLTLHAEQFLRLSVYLIKSFPGLYTPGSDNAVIRYVTLTHVVMIIENTFMILCKYPDCY